MVALRAGLAVRSPNPVETLATIVRAEQQGLPAVWSTVGGTNPDAVSLFAAAAAQTSSIGLGTAIVPTYPRHPVALATQALVLAALAPGRFRLGIGPSHRPTIEGMFGIPMRRPLDHLREYLTILRGLLWEGSAEFAGEHFQVRAKLPDGVEPPKTPLPISALRAGAFRLAGEIADGAISWVCPVPYLVNTAKPALEAGAQAAGRPAPPLIGHVSVAVGTGRAAIRAAARPQLANYARLPFYQGMFADAGYPIPADNTMPDALLDELVVSGTPDEIAVRLHQIQAAGVDELLIMRITVEDGAAEEQTLIELLAREAAAS
ncbi:MAG: LLM class flavin-dependent oxidoreductase [Chloroflexi bacterium]|nr:LLM class flavin-dependent oxidoreductase [Chloroflexota bacterium]